MVRKEENYLRALLWLDSYEAVAKRKALSYKRCWYHLVFLGVSDVWPVRCLQKNHNLWDEPESWGLFWE